MSAGIGFEAVEKHSFFEQPLDRNHGFDRLCDSVPRPTGTIRSRLYKNRDAWPRLPSLDPSWSIHLESASFRFRLFGENCMRSLAPRFPLANSSLVCQGRKTGETEWEQAPPVRPPPPRRKELCFIRFHLRRNRTPLRFFLLSPQKHSFCGDPHADW